MAHVSDFTKQEGQIVLDLINFDNETNLTQGEVSIAHKSRAVPVETVTVSAVPGSGYAGSKELAYNLINIADFVDLFFPEGLLVPQGEAQTVHDLLDDVNSALGTAISASVVVDAPLTWEGNAGEELNVPFTIDGSANSLVYYGQFTLRVDGNDIPLESAISVKTLSGLNMPSSEEPETEYLFSSYKADTTQTVGGQPNVNIQFMGEPDGQMPDISWRFTGQGQTSAWINALDYQAAYLDGAGFLTIPMDAQYADAAGKFEIRANVGYTGFEDLSIRVNVRVSELEYFQTDRQPVVEWNKPYLTKVPTYLPRSVVSLSSMFAEATAFNDVAVVQWDTRRVTKMDYVFGNAQMFNQNIGAWRTESATTMEDMFYGAVLFNQNLSAWNVGAVVEHSGFDTNTPSWTAGKPSFPA